MSEEDNVQAIEVTEHTQPTQAEVEAGELGWVTQDQYKGNPEEWKDAESFLRRGKEINGFLRKENEKIQKQIQQRDKDIVELRETMELLQQHHNETKKRTYERVYAELKQEKATAIEQGDGNKVVDIDEKLSQLKESEKPEPTKVVKQEVKFEKEFNDWNSKNPWFGTDDVLTALATGFGDTIRSTTNLVGVEFIQEVEKRVKAAMPEKFGNPNREDSPVSSNGQTRSTPSKKKTYNDLPADAKVICDRFTAQKARDGKPLMTKEEYVAEYFSE